MKRKIALIIPYFGALPHWFPYFLKSVAHSPMLQVLLFTDSSVGQVLPDNVTVHPCSLSDFNAQASRALSLSISIAFPYKVCDFKPAFGEVFQEYIRDFEFWAFGDIDLVYGDVAAFLQPLLRDHDVISFAKGWISGSLCVLRNCKEVNSLFRRSADWQKVFLSAECELFDEMGGHLYPEVLKGADVVSLKGKVESFTHLVKASCREGSLRCAFTDFACEELDWGETIIYEAGKLTRLSDGSAVMYLHYVAMKRRFFEVPATETVPGRFYLRKTGIYLTRIDAGVIVSQETGRVIRGAIHGAQRLLGRHIG